MGYELFQERDDLQKRLSHGIDLMAKYGNEYARTRQDYEVEKAKMAVRLREEGMPVTQIQMVIYGTGNVPKKRFERDTAEVMYKTAQENINSLKLQLRLVEAQIDREWGQAKRDV